MIYILSSGKTMLAPFRDSFLTRVLKPAFLGTGKTYVLITLNPIEKYLAESVNTIRFARYARKVKTKFLRKDDHGLSNRCNFSSHSPGPNPANFRKVIDMKSKQRVSLANLFEMNSKLTRENIDLKNHYKKALVNEVIEENNTLKKEIELLKKIRVKQAFTETVQDTDVSPVSLHSERVPR